MASDGGAPTRIARRFLRAWAARDADEALAALTQAGGLTGLPGTWDALAGVLARALGGEGHLHAASDLADRYLFAGPLDQEAFTTADALALVQAARDGDEGLRASVHRRYGEDPRAAASLTAALARLACEAAAREARTRAGGAPRLDFTP